MSKETIKHIMQKTGCFILLCIFVIIAAYAANLYLKWWIPYHDWIHSVCPRCD